MAQMQGTAALGVALRGLSLSGEVCNRTEGRQSGYTLSQDHRVSVPWFKLSSQVKGQNKECSIF